jgi:hypothetical protein
MATKNEKGKTRPVDQPYETYAAGGFEWRVLKHYQSEEGEAANEHARVFCATMSPYTFGRWEYGDAYLADILEAVRTHGSHIEG